MYDMSSVSVDWTMPRNAKLSGPFRVQSLIWGAKKTPVSVAAAR